MAEPQSKAQCPACGGALSRQRVSEGLCPGCLLELALESPSLLAELDSSDEAPTLEYAGDQTFSEGRVHGDRYRVRSLLGRGHGRQPLDRW